MTLFRVRILFIGMHSVKRVRSGPPQLRSPTPQPGMTSIIASSGEELTDGAARSAS